jgi:hypothetical protein
VITTIVEGSIITYQCEEGLMNDSEGEVNALCGADGEWRPHPTALNCSDVTSEMLPTRRMENETVSAKCIAIICIIPVCTTYTFIQHLRSYHC